MEIQSIPSDMAMMIARVKVNLNPSKSIWLILPILIKLFWLKYRLFVFSRYRICLRLSKWMTATTNNTIAKSEEIIRHIISVEDLSLYGAGSYSTSVTRRLNILFWKLNLINSNKYLFIQFTRFIDLSIEIYLWINRNIMFRWMKCYLTSFFEIE